MSGVRDNSILSKLGRSMVVAGLCLTLLNPSVLYAGDKKKDKEKGATAQTNTPQGPPKTFLDYLDYSKIVWPNPPAITRIRYLTYWSGEKLTGPKQQAEKKKASWMERVAGVTTGETANSEDKPKWQLVQPSGVAVDSKGRAYVTDAKVRAIFVVDSETGKFDMIKNGTHAKFQWLTSIAIDDSDYIFAGDSGMKRVLVFDPQYKLEATISEGLVDPSGIAIDKENRQLYVSDAEQDVVLVYDADPPYKLLRKIGTLGTKHASTAQGEFAKPTGIAVDSDGNLYVADTWNNRVEVFDADGQFIRSFGKSGDGPGYFARPKGVAIDGDGHLWVADAMQDRVQVFTPEGQLLIYMGGHGLYPGQFQSLAAITIDSNNRVFTTELFPGRMQVFRYATNAEALAEKKRRDEEAKKKTEERRAAKDAKPAEAPK